MPKLQYTDDEKGRQVDLGQLSPAAIAVPVTSAATTITLTNTSQLYNVAMGANTTFTFTADANAVAGDEYSLIFTQDATGSRVATWPSNFKKAGGSLVLTTTANAVDLIYLVYDGTNFHEGGRVLAQA